MGMHSINTTLFYAINDAARVYPLLDQFFITLTNYGIPVLVVGLVGYLFYTVPQRASTAAAKFHAYLQGIEVVTSTMMVWVIVHSIKVIAVLARPFAMLTDVRLLVVQEQTYSFPSMHAALAMVLATGVYLHHPRLGKNLFLFAGFIALSRVYVGVHYPIDIVVGLAIGFVIPLVIHRLFSTRKSPSVN